MVVGDRLVFVELHKTGGTHIGKWLNRLIDGKQVGKHNRVPPHLWDRFVLGSIRSPWDWYVSLWAFGCQGQGSVHRQTTRGLDIPYVRRQLDSEMGRTGLPLSAWVRQCWNDARKPTKKWRDAYRDANDPALFRDWLRLMMNPERRFDMGEGFGFSPVSESHGLLTYRVLKLFTRLGQELYEDANLARPEHVKGLWDQKRLVDFVVRTEHLEEDLLDALDIAGYALSDQQRTALRCAQGRKTNTSERQPAEFYYDQASIDLVGSRDWLIVETFGYQPPGSAS